MADQPLRRRQREYLASQVAEVGRLDPVSGADVHDLRVALRRIEAIVTDADLRRAVRTARRGLGGARDVEVLEQLLLPRISDPAERALVAGVLAGRVARAGTAPTDLAELRRVLERRSDVGLVGTHPRRERARILAKAAVAATATTDAEHWSALHDVRKATKRARYRMEAVGRPTKDLKHLQEVLGDQHDLVVGAELLRELGAPSPGGELIRLANELEDEAAAAVPAYRRALDAIREQG